MSTAAPFFDAGEVPRSASAAASRRRPPPACRHCGAPLLDARMIETGFCCSGCAYVFRLVHEHGLETYYQLKDGVTPPADPAVFQPRDFAWLDSLQHTAETAAAPSGAAPSLTLDLQGVSCAGCVWLIERLFAQQPGARDIVANAQLGQVHLRWLPGEFSAAAFARRLQSFGYLLGPRGDTDAPPESRALVKRIGLCAAFAMNVMLFTLPVYFGMESTFAYAPLFALLSLAFGTLSFLVGGVYFLGRAAQALRQGVLHIDLPISLGILGAYAGSLYGWLTGREHFVYFDFVSTFILLMLVGRWAQVAAVERNRRQLLRQQPVPPRLRVLASDGALRDTAPEDLRDGHVLLLAPGQTVPVECTLDAGAAEFSLASINGEAAPRLFSAGQRIPAGAVNLGRADLRLTARQDWADSLFAQLTRPATRATTRSALLEKIVRGYLLGIVAVALLAGAGWWLATHDPLRAATVVTAVLVVSCPCAIGLAFPLADEMATVALRRRGVFVREEDLWTRLHRVRRLVFDKTGTLTLETPVLQNPAALAALPAEARAALYTLVRDNAHPVSQCLLENLLAASPAAPLAGEVVETVGFGLALGPWSLGRPGWRTTPATDASAPASADARSHDTEFAHAGRVLARFHFLDTARPDARVELARLLRPSAPPQPQAQPRSARPEPDSSPDSSVSSVPPRLTSRSRGFEITILSGDRADKVSALAAELGLPPGHAFGELTPQAKADWIDRHDARDTLMLGDGANDSLAFDRAFCRGTPVIHRGLLERKADFYYLGRGIAGIRALFEVNAIRRRTQFAILAFSVAYNVLAVGLAVAGHMNPLVAAILMPVNSLLTLAIVTLGLRPAFRAS